MKNFYVLLILILVITVPSFSQWEKCENPKGGLYSCMDVKGDTIIAGDYHSRLMISTDNGDSWSEKKTDVTGFIILKIKFVNNRIISLTDKGIYILDEFDGNWIKKVDFIIKDNISHYKNKLLPATLHIINMDSKIVLTTPGEVYISEDNGDSWEEVIFHNGKRIYTNTAIGKDFYYSGYIYDKFDTYNKKDTILYKWNLDSNTIDTIFFNSRIYSITSNNEVIFVLLDNGVFESKDYGKSWAKRTTALNYSDTLYDKGNNDQAILLVEDDTFYIARNGDFSGYGLYRYVEKAENWELISMGQTFMLDVLRKYGKFYVVPYVGGIIISDEKANNWKTYGHGTSESSAVLIKDNIIYLSTKFALYTSDDSGKTWSFLSLGGNEVVSFDTAGNKLYSLCIGSIRDRELFVSENNGKDWKYLGNNIYSFKALGNRLIVGFNSGIGISNDSIISWEEKFIEEKYYFYSMEAIDDYVFAAYYGGVLKSDDFGKTWADVPELIAHGGLKRIYRIGSKLFVSEPISHRNYVSTDFGLTWEQINYQKPLKFAVSDREDVLFDITGEGLPVVSPDSGLTWLDFSQGLANKAKMAITHGEYIICETVDGIFRRKLSSINTSINIKNLLSAKFRIYPNPADDWIKIDSLKDNLLGPRKFIILNSLGEIIDKGSIDPGFTSISINNLSNGVYFLKIDNSVQRFVVLR